MVLATFNSFIMWEDSSLVEDMYRARSSKVWVTGKPLEALVYTDVDTKLNIYTDASAYRPDPRSFLKIDKIYPAQLVFEEVLIDSKHEELIRMVNVDGKIYAKVR